MPSTVMLQSINYTHIPAPAQLDRDESHRT